MKKVYLIKCANFYKIGISGKPKSRLKGLQTSNPIPLSLVALSTEYEPESLEKHLHEKFADVNSSGEWFELKESHLKELRIDYHFNFLISIPKLVTDSKVPNSLLESTKKLRAMNIQYQECLNYFNQLYCTNIETGAKLKRALNTYGYDIVMEAIDISYKIKEDYQDAYDYIPKMAKKIQIRKTDPGRYFSTYISGIFYNKFNDPLKPNEQEYLVNFYNETYAKYDIDKLCKYMRFKVNEFNDSMKFWNFLKDTESISQLENTAA